MPNLANRLSVHILHDLAKNCPKTIHAMASWMDAAAFWLADLASHPRTPDQAAFMIGLLGMSLATNLGITLPEACQMLKDETRFHQLQKELS